MLHTGTCLISKWRVGAVAPPPPMPAPPGLNGRVATLAGTAGSCFLDDLYSTLGAGAYAPAFCPSLSAVVFADASMVGPVVRRIDVATGSIITVAGRSEGSPMIQDGDGVSSASFGLIYGLACDAQGSIFVSDSGAGEKGAAEGRSGHSRRFRSKSLVRHPPRAKL